ncbi:MAG: AAA family ATPase [Desulfobacterales bacterium]
MYLTYYQLEVNPFSVSADPRFMWYGEKYQAALTTLRYGLVEKKGYVVLTGDIGTGKTTLMNSLIGSLDENTLVAKINHATLDASEFYNLIARSYDPTAKVADKSEFLFFFTSFLHRSGAQKKSALLVIDEAHRLSAELLEEIRLLSNVEHASDNHFNIVLVGQNDLKAKLLSDECRALRQRITLFYDLRPLSEDETACYIAHRLKVAGTEKKLFSAGAIHEVQKFSQGYPRLINMVCDRSLLSGWLQKRKMIHADMVFECAREISLLDPIPLKTGSIPVDKQFSSYAPTLISAYFSMAGLTKLRDLANRLKNGTTHHGRRIVDAARPLLDVFKKKHRWKLILVGMMIFIFASAVSMDLRLKSKIPERKPVVSASDSTHLDLINAALRQHDYEKAIALLGSHQNYNEGKRNEVREIYAQALVGRALQLMKTAPFKSETMMERAVAADPENAVAQLNLGKIYTQNNKLNLAIDAYQRAIALDPDSPDAIFNLGFIYARTDMFPEAERYFARVVELEPRYLDKALFNLAVVQEKLGKKQEGLVNLKKALSIRPDNSKFRSYLEQFERTTQKDL